MKVAGVIAEYNPFHNGHKYQLEQIRELTGADYIVVAMSGDFVQRGQPAIIDKYSRTQMALAGGADLVLELPVRYATSSAEQFACGGVDLLCHTGVIDVLCYGVESSNKALTQAILSVITDESESYKATLSSKLKSGLSYPAARAAAITFEFDRLGIDYDADALSLFLASPNNILALEYERALLGKHITSCPIPRIGAGYHEDGKVDGYASASYIRSQMQSAESINDLIPDEASSILEDYLSSHRLVNSDDFSMLLNHKLLELKDIGFAQYLDCSDELSNKIIKNIYSFESYESFVDLLKSKNMTRARISRALLHILLGIKDEPYATPAYLRVLGFKKSSSALLSQIKEKASAPIITKVADADIDLINADIHASDLYRSIAADKMSSYNEYTKGIIIP